MKFQLPSISSYGNYSSGNYGAHCLRVDLGPLTVWFSYSTAVAFHVSGKERVVHCNSWGPTTGKHLKWIDGCTSKTGTHRVNDKEFQRLWNEQVETLFNEEELKPFFGEILPKVG